MEASFEFEVRGGRESLVGLREALGSWLAESGVERRAADEIVLSCWEATLNALEHPAAPGSVVEISAERPDGHVVASVRDHGRWRAARRRGVHGLGMTLIGSLMDRVVVVRTGHGTRVIMCRCLDRDHAAAGETRVRPARGTITNGRRPHARRGAGPRRR